MEVSVRIVVGAPTVAEEVGLTQQILLLHQRLFAVEPQEPL